MGWRSCCSNEDINVSIVLWGLRKFFSGWKTAIIFSLKTVCLGRSSDSGRKVLCLRHLAEICCIIWIRPKAMDGLAYRLDGEISLYDGRWQEAD